MIKDVWTNDGKNRCGVKIKEVWTNDYRKCGLMLKEVWTNCLGSVD